MLQKHKYIKKERIRYRKTKTFKAKKGENEKGEKFLVGMLHIQKKNNPLSWWWKKFKKSFRKWFYLSSLEKVGK